MRWMWLQIAECVSGTFAKPSNSNLQQTLGDLLVCQTAFVSTLLLKTLNVESYSTATASFGGNIESQTWDKP